MHHALSAPQVFWQKYKMLFGFKKNLCSNTGHLLGWAETKIHMQKRWDTSILGLDEAFWIPGSWVLINYSFSCRNKTGIKEASTHTKHFSLTQTGLPSFQGSSRESGHEELWTGDRETLFNVMFRGGISGDGQEWGQPFLCPSQPEQQWFLKAAGW